MAAQLFGLPGSIAQVYPTGFRKLSRITATNITPQFNTSASFGIESSAIGDLDDDGVVDLAVGATNQFGSLEGAAYILFMNSDGTVPNQIRLYNRWDKEVMNKTNYKNDWTGGSLSPGMYFYFIYINQCDTELKGWLNIVN